MIHYLRGDATNPTVPGPKIIAHVNNDAGGWGRGFVLAVSKKWKQPEMEYRKWYGTPSFKLGKILLVEVGPALWVCNMVAQHDYGPVDKGQKYIQYPALAECLRNLSLGARGAQASVHMPRIGCGLGGGTWSEIEPLIEQNLKDIDTYVYDLE